nr:hypothetical protein [Mycobacterium sp. UM_NZ2]
MGDHIVVERLAVRYRVPAGHPRPAAVRAMLDNAATTSVPARCGDLLAGLPGGAEVVVVRRLDLRVVVRGSSGAVSSSAVGDAWGRGLAKAVRRALSADPDPRWLIRYPSPVHRLVRVLDDVASGRAASRWEHDSLRPLLGGRPGSAVVRILAEHRRAGGRVTAVLALLGTDPALARVATVIQESDAAAVTALMATEAGGAGSSLTSGEALALIAAWSEAGPFAALPGPLTLHLLARLADATTAAPSASGVRAAAELAEALPARLDAEPDAQPPPILVAVAARAGVADEALGPCAPPPPAAGGGSDGPAGTATSWGGLLLLVPELVALDAVLAPFVANRRDVLRWLVLLATLGQPHRRGARHDPVPALAAGCPGLPAGDDVAALVDGLPPESARRATRAVRRWYRGHAGQPLGRLRTSDQRHFDVARIVPRQCEPERTAELVALVAVTALALLRLFTRHLPHFAASRPGYLAQNFLVGPAPIDVAGDGLRLDLPDVPLRLVLVLAGWSGARHHVPWLPAGRLVFDREST